MHKTNNVNINDIYKKIQEVTEWYSPQKLRQLRKFKYRMTQAKFADLLKVKLGTYLGWELGRHTPCSPALALIYIAEHYPEILKREQNMV